VRRCGRSGDCLRGRAGVRAGVAEVSDLTYGFPGLGTSLHFIKDGKIAVAAGLRAP